MRYALVTETYPPEINGVALTVQSLEVGLRARGHEVTLIRPRRAGETLPGPHQRLTSGLPLPWYPGLNFGLPALGKLRREWTRHRPDAIYVATEGPLGWSALRVARQLGIPAATGFHTRFDLYMRDYGMPLLQRPALAWMRHVHAQGQATLVPTIELREALHAMGFADAVRLPRAVDCSLFDPARRDASLRAEWGADDNAPVAIHVGRMAAEKNLALAVRAFRAIIEARPDARCVWVGDGPERQALAAEHPDFVFCGLRRGDDLARHIASADLFVFPSRSETYGNVTLEALASGVPTVAFDYGAAREHLRDGVHGAAIANLGDVVDADNRFVAAARRIAEDPDLRKRMRVAAREAVLDLSSAQVASDFDAILHRLSQRGRRQHERDADQYHAAPAPGRE